MNKTTLIEFPCRFSIKVIGTNTDIFIEEIRTIVTKHYPNFEQEDLSHKLSQQNNYLAITVTVLAENKETLDALYCELTKHPDVRMVL